MSIISDALKKAGDKRRTIVRLSEKEIKRIVTSPDTKKPHKNGLRVISALAIAGFAVLVFLYNMEVFPTLTYAPRTQGMNAAIISPNLSAPVVTLPSAPKASAVILPAPKRRTSASDPFSSLELTGIMEGGGEALAIINDNILRKGDTVKGAEIVSIDEDSVTLLNRGKEVVLRIK